MASEAEPRTRWTFLTHHARVLLMVSRDPEVRLRDLADACGVTERAVQAIVTDLESAGYLTRTRVGRRNHYQVGRDTSFRHPAEAGYEIADFLRMFAVRPPGVTAGDDPTTLPSGDRRERDHRP